MPQLLLQRPALRHFGCGESRAMYLCGMQGPEAGVEAAALRTFQRRVLAWRLQHGQDKEVFSPRSIYPAG